MTTDVRELILDRLAELIRVRGVAYSARNAVGFSDGDSLPGIILQDGSELANDLPRGRVSLSIYPVLMEPMIYITAQGDEARIGTDLNGIRLRVIAAVLEDEVLRGLSADGTGVRYLGCSTKWSAGRAVQGDVALRFSILYYLRPKDF